MESNASDFDLCCVADVMPFEWLHSGGACNDRCVVGLVSMMNCERRSDVSGEVRIIAVVMNGSPFPSLPNNMTRIYNTTEWLSMNIRFGHSSL